MNKRLLLILMLATVGTANAQVFDNSHEQARFNIKLGDIDKAVIFYAQCVDHAKAARNAGKGVSGELLAEYAYALALHHDFEAALINIDRALMLDAANGPFFAGQILTIMGHPTAAFQISGYVPGQHYNIPYYSKWIDGLYQNLTPKFSSKTTVNRDSPQEALKRAAALTVRGQTVQAIVIYEELLAQFPNAYIIPASYSSLWEKRDNRVYAATLLKRGIELMGSDTTGRAAFADHLRTLEIVQPHGWEAFTKGLHTIIYTGASFGKGMSSINGRVGVSTEKKFSLSLNANVIFRDSTSFGSVGLSAYKTWSFFVLGLGVSRQLSSISKSWGLAPSVGLTFINRRQTASFDIMADWQIPFSDETKPSFNLSIGTTFYLDLKKDKK